MQKLGDSHIHAGKTSIFLISLLVASVFVFFPLSVSASPPQRIISLAPNITEILFAIGLGDRLVGVTRFCDYPEGARKIRKIGGMSNPSLETVVSLKPDIVVLTTDGNPKEFEERLRSLGIRTYVFRAQRLAELPAAIRSLGVALGAKEKACALAEGVEGAVRKTSLRHPHGVKQKVLFVVWPEPLIVAGRETLIDDVISLFGRKNIAAGAQSSYPKYSIEEIIRQAPDVVLIGKGHENVREMSGSLLKKIAAVPAVRDGKVFYLSDNLFRMGPRIIAGIEEMAACLR
ncbi:MAG: cobalamin-binding protein [Nitrospirota bacterium]